MTTALFGYSSVTAKYCKRYKVQRRLICVQCPRPTRRWNGTHLQSMWTIATFIRTRSCNVCVYSNGEMIHFYVISDRTIIAEQYVQICYEHLTSYASRPVGFRHRHHLHRPGNKVLSAKCSKYFISMYKSEAMRLF